MNKRHIETDAVHAGTAPDAGTGGVNTPIYTSTAYHFVDEDALPYPRYNNTPNLAAAAQKIAALENCEAGLIFSSGMAAVTTGMLTFLKAGDHAVVQNDIYGGTRKFIEKEFGLREIKYTFVEKYDVEAFAAAYKPQTKLVYVESPSNPMLQIIDLSMIARFAKEKGIVSMIDNTFASPVNQNPADYGIDIILHSATKYLSGHSDILCGTLCGSNKMMEMITGTAIVYGGTLDANAAYLLERSLKTVVIRVQRQNENAMKIAEWLEKQSMVNKVFYPGLASHPQHELAKKQMRGFGGMISFEIAGERSSVDRFLNGLSLITPALSLGGVESIITTPARSSHRGLSIEERNKAGISDTLLRLSVGIENAEDIITDLGKGLRQI